MHSPIGERARRKRSLQSQRVSSWLYLRLESLKFSRRLVRRVRRVRLVTLVTLVRLERLLVRRVRLVRLLRLEALIRRLRPS